MNHAFKSSTNSFTCLANCKQTLTGCISNAPTSILFSCNLSAASRTTRCTYVALYLSMLEQISTSDLLKCDSQPSLKSTLQPGTFISAASNTDIADTRPERTPQ